MQRCEQRESIVLENQGQKIFGILHCPLNSSSHPAILICHGLGGHKAGKYRMYVLLSQKLAEMGIASLRIDFRGSGDSEGDFSEMTLEGEKSDALKGLEFLSQHPSINTKRIGIFGRSVGGMVAIMAAKKYGHIKSLAIWAPLFDGHQWVDQWNLLHTAKLSEERRHSMMRVNGQVPGYAFFKELFTADIEKEMQGLENIPLLHIHGKKDAIISTEHAVRYEKSRKGSSGLNKFILLPESDHDFSHPEEQKLAMEETCQWFKQTL